jgi:predicted phage terminase large subunit-like protein
MLKRRWFDIVPAAPLRCRRVRKWDLAGTRKIGGNDPDWTVGALLARDQDSGIVYIEHVERFRETPNVVEAAILNYAAQDRARYGRGVIVGLPEDAGQAGKMQAGYIAGKLGGFVVKIVKEDRVTGSKQVRATPFAAQAEAGNVRLVEGPWNEAFLSEAEVFPAGAHDDQIDAAAGAFNILVERSSADEWIAHFARLAGEIQDDVEPIRISFDKPWAPIPPPRPQGNELTEMYFRAVDAHKPRAFVCAGCGQALGETRVSDGISAWHPACAGFGVRFH